MQLKGKKINFLGDSITEGSGASCPENAYHQVMKRMYGLAEARNYGIGGTRYARQEHKVEGNRMDLDFCQRLHEMDPDADIVVVFGGTNDFGHGDAPLGTFEDREPNTFYGACHYIFTQLIEKYPDAPIVVLNPLHRLKEEYTDGDQHQKTYHSGNLKVYVDIIEEVAEYYSLPVVDLYRTSGLQPNHPAIRAKYMPDGLHPNDLGHARIAERVGNFLLAY